MREVTTRIYKFDELSEQAKEKARDWYKDIMSEDFTAEAEMITENMIDYIINEGGAGESISDLSVNWSLSCRQGDGVSFTGIIYGYDKSALELFNHVYDNNIPKNVRRILHGINVKFIKKSTRYCHKNTVTTDIEITGNYCGEINRIEAIIEDIEIAIDSWRDGLCDKLEKLGYEQIDYYYSNECVDETIIANEYEFTEEGDRYNG